MVPSLPCEAQASAYGILLKFLTSTKKAQERAAVWFEDCPSLQNVFIDSYSKHFSEVLTHRNESSELTFSYYFYLFLYA